MPINAFPIATVPPSANLIINVPAGSVTSTDVQAAINELAGLIPSPGPGTDPLFLVHGFSVVADNPTVSGNSTDRWLARFRMTTDCSQADPLFANSEVLNISLVATNGQSVLNALTTAKETFFGWSVNATYNASGQKFATNENVVSYGMSDTAIGQQSVQYAGGPVNGDEGQGFRLVSGLSQQTFVMATTVSTVTRSLMVSTTTGQAIVRNKDPQTVIVVSTAGAVVGDWVVIEQELPNGGPNLEAVQITAFSPTSITGVFRNTHNIGATVTPALRLTCPSTFQMGQDRVLVNLSGASYSTGTVSSISGGGLTGTGTAWANNMVGGSATNIGAVTLAADDYTGSPFDAGANRLRSWYQINGVGSATTMGVWTFSVAGDTSYRGKGPGAGTYVVRPCARILHIGASGGSVNGEIICETSTATWTAGNAVECVICPYPDVKGFQYFLAGYTNGGTYRGFMDVFNSGARTFEIGISIGRYGGAPVGVAADADTVAWDKCITLLSCNYGITILDAKLGAMLLSGAFAGGGTTDLGGTIRWGSGDAGLGPDSTNFGLTLKTLINGSSGAFKYGVLEFFPPSTSVNPDVHRAEMLWHGFISLPVTDHGGNQPGYINIDNAISQVNYERGFWRWTSNVMEVGTENGGTGTLRDVVLRTGAVEQIRLIAGSNIKVSNPASFSANGSVATAITSVGPTGAATTVQKWLTIKDDGGVTRYIPCF